MESQQSRTAAAAGEVKEKVKSDVSGVVDEIKRKGEQQIESQKHSAADQTQNLASVVERAADELREHDQQSLADYAGQLAGSMKSFADSLRNRSTDELLRDTQQVARNNPTLFVLGSVAVGLALSRFLKASAERPVSSSTDRYSPPTAEHGEQPSAANRPLGGGPTTGMMPCAEDDPAFADDLNKGI